jgi:large subunit ribosomal protein L35
MPKIKTKKAAAKRFKITASGKVLRSKANKQHILGKKSPKRKRRLRGLAVADKTNLKVIKQMLAH